MMVILCSTFNVCIHLFDSEVDYETDTGDLEHARIHPKFLHSNATSHKWAFGGNAFIYSKTLILQRLINILNLFGSLKFYSPPLITIIMAAYWSVLIHLIVVLFNLHFFHLMQQLLSF